MKRFIVASSSIEIDVKLLGRVGFAIELSAAC